MSVSCKFTGLVCCFTIDWLHIIDAPVRPQPLGNSLITLMAGGLVAYCSMSDLRSVSGHC